MSRIQPTVSILLPFFQAEATLKACLWGVLRQTLAEWECVLVDDGSSDAGPELARRATGEDPRLRLVTLPHSGLVSALNSGLEQCRAPLIARMDADDLMHRRRLELQVDLLRRHAELAGAGTRVRFFPRAGMSDGLRQYEEWLNRIDGAAAVRREAFIESPLAHPTLMIRREVLARFGYREAGWPEDYDLLLRLLGAGHELGIVPRRLHAWRDSSERLTRTAAPYRLENITACKAHHLAETFLRRHQQYVLWGHGDTGGALRRALRLHGKRPSHVIELHPGRLGNRIDGAAVVAPESIDGLPRLPLVASVAGAGPRAQIRAFLDARGWVEGRDYVCAA